MFVRFISGWKIIEKVSAIIFSSKSLSFGSMLSLVSTTGTVEVNSLGHYAVVFVSSDSLQVDVEVNNFYF